MPPNPEPMEPVDEGEMPPVPGIFIQLLTGSFIHMVLHEMPYQTTILLCLS